MSDFDIEKMVAAHPLPEGVPDAVLNKTELADFFAVSVPTIDAWQRAGMPANSDGTNGRAWEFQASHCWAWKQARDAEEVHRSAEAAAAIAAMRLQLIGGKAGDSIRSLSPKERQQLYAVEADYERLRRERNQSIDRDEVRQAFEDLLSLIRDAINAYPDRLERDAGLSGKAVEKATEYGDSLLDQLEKRIVEFFAARPLDERRDRPDLFNQ